MDRYIVWTIMRLWGLVQKSQRYRSMNGMKICAWCKTVVGESDTELPTHTICPDCLEKQEKELSLLTE